jgi:hypothetical protein
LPPCSGSKSKPRKLPTRSKQNELAEENLIAVQVLEGAQRELIGRGK